MTTTTKSNGQPKTESLSERHARLIEQYGKTTAGTKAVISRQIVETELDMTLEGVDFAAWVKPSNYKTNWVHSEAELVDQIVKLRALVADKATREPIKDAASRRLEKFEQQAAKRGVEVPA